MYHPRFAFKIVTNSFNLHFFEGWHSNIFCTVIFVLGKDESQGTTTKIVDGQKSNCLAAGHGQESTSYFT